MSVDDTTTAPPDEAVSTKLDLMRQADLLAIVKGRVTAAYNDVTKELRSHFEEGETVNPVYGAHKLGAVLVNRRMPQVDVTDPAALLDWVSTHYPAFIRQIVAPEFVKLLTITGNAQNIVGPDGEIDIPGVEVGYGAEAERVTVRRPAKADEDAILFDLLQEYRGRLGELLPGTTQ